MAPIIIRSKTITSLLSIVISVSAIALFPFIVIRDELTPVQMNHELIHFEQQKELYIIGFYILYVYDYMKGVLRYKNKDLAYRSIRFEQETYSNESDLGYIQKRKPNNWKKYSV
jgi:hypothetical protein|tara:strand:- start:5545 stop:5886 length:342 start_codon:yes stop_codon:yes gene_type:complete